MYLFQISNYDDPAVDRETAELLHQRLEAESRRRCPAIGTRPIPPLFFGVNGRSP